MAEFGGMCLFLFGVGIVFSSVYNLLQTDYKDVAYYECRKESKKKSLNEFEKCFEAKKEEWADIEWSR